MTSLNTIRKAGTRNNARPAARRQRKAREFALQVAVVEMVERYGVPNLVFFHIPNGEKRNAVTGAKLRRMGVRAGAADLAFVLPPHGRAAFLELKAPGSNASESADQEIFATNIECAGARYAVADSVDRAIEILAGWNALRFDPRRPAITV